MKFLPHCNFPHQMILCWPDQQIIQLSYGALIIGNLKLSLQDIVIMYQQLILLLVIEIVVLLHQKIDQ